MANLSVAELEAALVLERQMMKRQILLRQIWRKCRGAKHDPTESGQPGSNSGDDGMNTQSRTNPSASAHRNGKHPPASASTDD